VFQRLSRLQGAYANRNSLIYLHSLLDITVLWETGEIAV